MIDFILRPFRRNFGKDKRFYAAIDDMFGFIPNNIELYKLALIHKSASVTMEDGSQVNNERLEYLGDAVIESVTSDYLFIEFPDKNEGFLTQLRSKMVSRQTLNEVAKRIGLDDYVISHTSNNVSQKHIYGDAFEAMMGAIYLDQGYDFVNRLLINKIFVDYIKVEKLTESETDFKSRLIEWCQKNHHQIYFSTHNDIHFSSTHPSFYSKVLIDNIEVGYGVGDSKKEAEQRAAFSVAQGVTDDDCTKLMDELDLLESQEVSIKNRANVKSEKPSKTVASKRSQNSKNREDAKADSTPETTTVTPVKTVTEKAADVAANEAKSAIKDKTEGASLEVAEVPKDAEPATKSVKPASKPRTKRTSRKSAHSAVEQGVAVKEQDASVKEQGVAVKEQDASVREQNIAMKEPVQQEPAKSEKSKTARKPRAKRAKDVDDAKPVSTPTTSAQDGAVKKSSTQRRSAKNTKSAMSSPNSETNSEHAATAEQIQQNLHTNEESA